MSANNMRIILDGDGCWPDLLGKMERVELGKKASVSMALLPQSTASGKAAVSIRIDLPNGEVTIAQVTLDLLRAAVRAFDGREQYLADEAAAAKKGGDA